MIDILTLIYSYIESPYDVHSLMSTNAEFYSLSEKWRKDNWSFYGLPLAPYQVNLKNIKFESGHVNFPDNHRLSILKLLDGKRAVILVNNKNMKPWVELIRATVGFFDEDPAKSNIIVNHTSVRSHYTCANKLSLFSKKRIMISTPTAFMAIKSIEDVSFHAVYDYDVAELQNKYRDSMKIVLRVKEYNDATRKYVKRSENFIPDVNITYVSPNYSINSAAKLFKNKKSIYIATSSGSTSGIDGYRIVRSDSDRDAFIDDEGDAKVAYIDYNYYSREYIPYDNVIIYSCNNGNYTLELMEKFFLKKRTFEVIIIPKIQNYIRRTLKKQGLKCDHYFDTDVVLHLIYALCKAFECDIEKLNKCELSLLFKPKYFNIETWNQQSDNKFTRKQVDIILATDF